MVRGGVILVITYRPESACIYRIFHGGEEIWILCSSGNNDMDYMDLFIVTQ